MLHQPTRQTSRITAANLGDAHRTFLEETLFDAVITAAAIVAVADGQADASERAELVSFVGRSHWLSTFTPVDTGDAFDSRVREFELSSGVPPSAFSSLHRVGDTLGIREVICAAGEVAFADGRMQPSEETALGLIQSAIKPLLTTRHD